MFIKPSIVSTSFGSWVSSSSFVSFSNVAILESTEFIMYFFIFSSCSFVIFPFSIYIFAVFVAGLAPPLIICKHSASEFALWSNPPGRNSTPNTLFGPKS